MMFIRNYSSLPSNLVWVNKKSKDYLELNGFCVLSYKDGLYAFIKTNELLNILSLKKGDKDG